MKNLGLLLLILIGGVPAAWAEDLAMAAVAPAAVHSILNGVIKSVSMADPIKGTESEIVVLDASRKKINILITATTTLWDAEAKAIMWDKIVPRRRVNVIYIPTPEGINVAKSIKILK